MKLFKSKVDIIYDLIMEGITNNEFTQGDRLVISSLAKQYETSDIPVREAIRKLASEGYVTAIPNQSPVITGLSQDKLTSIIHIKSLLEGYATRVAADFMTEDDLQALKQINEHMQRNLENIDDNLHPKLNLDFHYTIYHKVPCRELIEMIDDLNKRFSVTRSVFSRVPQIRPKSVQEHEKIIELIRQKNYNQLEFFVRKHKMDAGMSLLKERFGSSEQNIIKYIL